MEVAFDASVSDMPPVLDFFLPKEHGADTSFRVCPCSATIRPPQPAAAAVQPHPAVVPATQAACAGQVQLASGSAQSPGGAIPPGEEGSKAPLPVQTPDSTSFADSSLASALLQVAGATQAPQAKAAAVPAPGPALEQLPWKSRPATLGQLAQLAAAVPLNSDEVPVTLNQKALAACFAGGPYTNAARLVRHLGLILCVRMDLLAQLKC